MNNSTPSMLKPALIGGVVFGVVGGIPFVNMLNCACCALVIGGGFLAAYLYSNQCKTSGVQFSPGSGALLGLLAGVFYSIANSIVGTLISLATGFSFEETLEQVEQFGEIPPQVEEAIEFLVGAGPFLLFIIGFFFTLVIAAIFSTIGGLIGGAVFKVEPQPPAPTAGAPGPPPPAPLAPGGGGGSGGPPPVTPGP